MWGGGRWRSEAPLRDDRPKSPVLTLFPDAAQRVPLAERCTVDPDWNGLRASSEKRNPAFDAKMLERFLSPVCMKPL